MARELAKRSLCSRDRVGCIITDKSNKVIGEGYNGPPAGFWHANAPCTQWCPRAGAADWRAGKPPYEGAADFPEWARSSFHGPHKDYSDCPALHAEANALMTSDRTLRVGGTIYVTSDVCYSCAKLIANSGITHVYVETETVSTHRDPGASYTFLASCGLEVRVNGVNLSRKASQK